MLRSLSRKFKNVTAANRAKVPVAVCGEMASQPLTAYALIGLGVRTMSVAPRSMTLVKRLVRGTDARVAAVCAGEAMKARTAASSEAIIFKSFASTFGDVTELFDGLP